MIDRSGTEIGAENVASLRAYLDRLAEAGERLPLRAGKPNLSAIAIACGFDRQVLYKNPAAKALIDDIVAKIPEQPEATNADTEEKPVSKTDRRDRRIMQLEQDNASLRAENQSLRDRLRRIEHVEEIMVQSGRRVAP
jgi:hypothetical protein